VFASGSDTVCVSGHSDVFLFFLMQQLDRNFLHCLLLSNDDDEDEDDDDEEEKDGHRRAMDITAITTEEMDAHHHHVPQLVEAHGDFSKILFLGVAL